jgi:hypothetical protein
VIKTRGERREKSIILISIRSDNTSLSKPQQATSHGKSPSDHDYHDVLSQEMVFKGAFNAECIEFIFLHSQTSFFFLV